jgi:hypothetical protein
VGSHTVFIVWGCKKFTGNALKCIIIDSTAKLEKYSVDDLCKADIVLVPAGLIEEGSGQYTKMLSRKAGAGAIPLAPSSESWPSVYISL